MQIVGLVLASPDVAATERAWQRLRVDGVGLEFVAGEAALSQVVLGVEDVAATERLLIRRGLIGNAAGFDLGGTSWRLAPVATSHEASNESAVGPRVDHVVVVAGDADRTTANLGARLGLDLRLDRAVPEGGFRGLFFRCGEAIIEVVVAPPGAAAGPDTFGGIAWRVGDLEASRRRLVALGVDVSEIRPGRKPGTRVATVRDADLVTPTLLICSA